jgi:predicted RNA binding protein YcfA (HicA-like mRNA interferase family)
VRPREQIGVLKRLGFVRTRKSRGSHQRFAHPDGRRTTVPMHKGKTIGRGLLRKILKDIGITADEFAQFL